MLEPKALKNSLVGVASLERQMGFPPQWWKPEQPLGSWGRWGRRWISCGLDSEGKARDWLPSVCSYLQMSRGWHLVMVTRSILSQQATWRTEMGQASVVATLLPRSEKIHLPKVSGVKQTHTQFRSLQSLLCRTLSDTAQQADEGCCSESTELSPYGPCLSLGLSLWMEHTLLHFPCMY